MTNFNKVVVDVLGSSLPDPLKVEVTREIMSGMDKSKDIITLKLVLYLLLDGQEVFFDGDKVKGILKKIVESHLEPIVEISEKADGSISVKPGLK